MQERLREVDLRAIRQTFTADVEEALRWQETWGRWPIIVQRSPVHPQEACVSDVHAKPERRGRARGLRSPPDAASAAQRAPSCLVRAAGHAFGTSRLYVARPSDTAGESASHCTKGVPRCAQAAHGNDMGRGAHSPIVAMRERCF